MLIVEEDDPSFARDALRIGARELVPTALSGAMSPRQFGWSLPAVRSSRLTSWTSGGRSARLRRPLPASRPLHCAAHAARDGDARGSPDGSSQQDHRLYASTLGEHVKTHLRNIMRKARRRTAPSSLCSSTPGHGSEPAAIATRRIVPRPSGRTMTASEDLDHDSETQGPAPALLSRQPDRVQPRRTVLPCIVRDRTTQGMRVILEGARALPTEFDLVIADKRQKHRAHIVWRISTRWA